MLAPGLAPLSISPPRASPEPVSRSSPWWQVVLRAVRAAERPIAAGASLALWRALLSIAACVRLAAWAQLLPELQVRSGKELAPQLQPAHRAARSARCSC